MARESNVDLPDGLDALLRRSMSVDPSPAFLPRVRERIATEQPALRWSWRMLAVSGAAAVVIIVAVALSRIDDPSVPPPAPQVPVVQTAPPLTPAMPPAPEPLARHEAAPVLARVPRVDVRTSRTEDMPAVIVDERQRAALHAVMRMVERGQLTEEAFAHTVPPSMQPIEERVLEIVITPVQVSPLNAGGVLQVGPEQKRPPRLADAGFSRP